MRIPESKIEEIRNSVSIVDVISEYVPLRKRGKNYIGLCPFHSEKTPSFTVTEEKQIFHCFGCHAGGNVFKFLMDYKKYLLLSQYRKLQNSRELKSITMMKASMKSNLSRKFCMTSTLKLQDIFLIIF